MPRTPSSVTSRCLSGGSCCNRGTKRACRLLLAICVALFTGKNLQAQQKNGGSQSQSPGQSGGGQSGPGQSGQQGSPNGNGPSPGITGGTSPIESVLFAYKALASDGAAISGQINSLLSGHTPAIVVIATPADISAIIQWRAVMGQLSVLDERAEASGLLATPDIPQYSRPVSSPTPPTPSARFGLSPTGAGEVQTLAQTALTLAGIFAVNESLASSAGAITDVPLINVVARDLRSNSVAVFVPSVYAPNLLHNTALENTYIWDRLTELEGKRVDVLNEVQEYLQALDDATTVAAAPDSSQYSAADKVLAKNFANEAKTIAALVADLNSIVAAIDTFEGTLFSGQTTNPSSNANPNATNNNNANTVPNGASTGTTGTTGPMANNNAPGTIGANNPAPSLQLGGGNQSGGTTLQQILLGDLLAHQIWAGADPPSENVLNTIHVLSVHALESGGGLLTKSWLIIGSRIYFSGGAVATFSLFGVNGGVECSGFAYDYSGYVREKHFEHELRADKQTSAVITTGGSCLLSASSDGHANQDLTNSPAHPQNVSPNASSVHELLLPVRVDGKAGYINTKGRLVIRPKFTRGDDFSEGLAAAYTQGTNDPWPLAGYIDLKGNWVIKPQFVWAGPMHEGFARIKLSDQYGSHAFVSSKGKIVSVPHGDVNGMILGDVVEGLAAYSADDGKFGFLDVTGTVAINPQFEDADAFSEGLALVKVKSRYGFIDNKGSFAIPAKYAYATDFRNGRALVCVEQGQNCGSIDKADNFTGSAVPLLFDRWGSGYTVNSWSDTDGLHVIKGNEGYSDDNGNVVIGPKYYREWEFSEGLAAQDLDQSGTCGYIDRTGKMVIQAVLTSCGYFENGYAWISKVDQDSGTRMGYIDKNGKFLWLAK